MINTVDNILLRDLFKALGYETTLVQPNLIYNSIAFKPLEIIFYLWKDMLDRVKLRAVRYIEDRLKT